MFMKLAWSRLEKRQFVGLTLCFVYNKVVLSWRLVVPVTAVYIQQHTYTPGI